MFQRKTFVSALLVSALALPAFAQDAAAPAAVPAAAPAPDSGSQRSGVEVINITARKVSENLQQSPLSVSAFSADSIESLGIGDTQDISSMAPNLYMTQTPGSSANMALAIRGVAGAEPLLTREQGVAIYMDGAYIARVTGAIMDLVDIERIEVLRGPQGTLYGRNSTGGAVNFISAKPTEDFNFMQRLGSGSYGRLESVTRINTGEMLPGLAAKLSYVHHEENGYRNNRLQADKNDFGATNTDAFRIALGWDATENLRLDYAFDDSNQVGRGPGFQLVAISPTLSGALTAGFVNVNNLQIGKQAFNSLANDFDGPSEHTIRGHNLTLDWDLGFTHLTTIVTQRSWDNTEKGTELDGNDLGPVGVLTLPFFSFAFLPDPNLFDATNERHQNQWSAETRLDGDIGEQIKYVAGFYYFNEDFDEDNFQRFLFPFSPFAPPLSLSNPFKYSGDSRSWALFANSTWTLPFDFLDDRLSVSAGVRYSDDQKSFDRTSPISSSGSDSWTSVDWDVAVNYAATDNINIYFRGASAYKAGGYNLRSALPVIDAFDPERVKSVEIGAKTEWWDNRARLNVTGFWSISTNRQTDVFAAGPGGATSITINAGEAVIPGVEIEGTLIPIDGLTFDGNFGFISPKYNEYNIVDSGTGAVVNLAHEAAFGYTPDITASLGAEYATAPLGSSGIVLTARIDGRFTDSRVWSPLDDERSSNQPVVTAFRDILEDPSYWLMDMRLTVSEISLTERAKVRASLYGKNVLDENYMLSGIDFGALGFAGGAYGQGATWGIDFTLDY